MTTRPGNGEASALSEETARTEAEALGADAIAEPSAQGEVRGAGECCEGVTAGERGGRLGEPEMARALADEARLAAMRDSLAGEIERAAEETVASPLPTLTERNHNEERSDEMRARLVALDAEHGRLVEDLVARGLVADAWTDVGGEAVHPRKVRSSVGTESYERWQVLRAMPVAARRSGRWGPDEVVRLSANIRRAAARGAWRDVVAVVPWAAAALSSAALVCLLILRVLGGWLAGIEDPDAYLAAGLGLVFLIVALGVALLCVSLKGAFAGLDALDVWRALRELNRTSGIHSEGRRAGGRR